MKKTLVILSLLASFSAIASINNVNQLYYGKGGEDGGFEKGCGLYGRVATVAEIESLGTDPCRFRWEDSEYKLGSFSLKGNDGNIWSFVPKGLNGHLGCEIISGGTQTQAPICTMQDEAPYGQAFLYRSYSQGGGFSYDGLAKVVKVGDSFPEAPNNGRTETYRSVTAGENVKVVVYSEKQHTGSVAVLTGESTAPFFFKSYKVETIIPPKELLFTFETDAHFRTCLQVAIADGGNSTICSDSGSNTVSLGDIPQSQATTINLVVFLTSYRNPEVPESFVGQIVLDVEKESQIVSINHVVLPENLSLELENNHMRFFYEID